MGNIGFSDGLGRLFQRNLGKFRLRDGIVLTIPGDFRFVPLPQLPPLEDRQAPTKPMGS